MNRIILNETSYHGKGARKALITEVQKRAYKKALLCTDPNLIEIGLSDKITDLLDEHNLAYSVFSDIKPNPTIEWE